MRKVKVFQSHAATDIEEVVNKWFDDNPNVAVWSVLQSQSISGDGWAKIVITIFYEE